MDKLSQLNPLLEQMYESRPAAVKLFYEKPPLRDICHPVKAFGVTEIRTAIRVVFIQVKKGPGKGSKRTIRILSFF